MRLFEDRILYTKYERFKANENIFDYIFKYCVFYYDELIIKKHKKCIIYIYKVKDITLKIIINSDAKIFTEIKYKNTYEKGTFDVPNGNINYDDYKEIILYYFDKLLYTIFLSATDVNFKVKNIDEINKNLKFILKNG